MTTFCILSQLLHNAHTRWQHSASSHNCHIALTNIDNILHPVTTVTQNSYTLTTFCILSQLSQSTHTHWHILHPVKNVTEHSYTMTTFCILPQMSQSAHTHWQHSVSCYNCHTALTHIDNILHPITTITQHSSGCFFLSFLFFLGLTKYVCLFLSFFSKLTH